MEDLSSPKIDVAHTFRHFSFKCVQEFFQNKNLENKKKPNKTPTKPTKNNNYKKLSSS